MVNHRREFNPELDDGAAKMKSGAISAVQANDGVVADRPYILGRFDTSVVLSIVYAMRGHREGLTVESLVSLRVKREILLDTI